MKTLVFRVFLVITLFFAALPSQAQETDTYSDAWLFLNTKFKLNDKWSAANELHWRMTDFVGKKQQLLIRPFMTYKHNETVGFSVGYSFALSYPYSSDILEKGKPEHNFWEQVSLSHKQGKVSFGHRFRLEHRFQGNMVIRGGKEEVDGYEFGNRFRYRFTLKRPLSEKFFIHLFDEIWVKMNDSFQSPSYDRNWLYLGLGYKVTPNSNIQLAYLHQNVKKSSLLFERHPTLQISYGLNFDFSK